MKNHVLLLVFLTSLVLVSGSFFPKTSNGVDVQGPAFSFGVMTAMGPSQIRLGNPLLGQAARSRVASSGLEHCRIAAMVDVKCHFVV